MVKLYFYSFCFSYINVCEVSVGFKLYKINNHTICFTIAFREALKQYNFFIIYKYTKQKINNYFD